MQKYGIRRSLPAFNLHDPTDIEYRSIKKRRIQGTLKEHELYYNALKNGKGHEAYNILINHLLMPIRIHEESEE